MPGTGQIVVNRMDFKEYFKSKVQHVMVTQPLVLTDHSEEFDVYINVRGGRLYGTGGRSPFRYCQGLIAFRF